MVKNHPREADHISGKLNHFAIWLRTTLEKLTTFLGS
jgi:hypothetical protein